MFEGAYFVVAASAFLAVTALPFYSEIVLVPLLIESKDPVRLWIAATLGNTMGAVVNWYLGRFMLHYQDRSWFPVNRQQLVRAQAWFQRYGVWSLLFAWLPIGGDALTFIAGIMRVRFGIFFLLTGAGKGARYAVIIYLTGVFNDAHAIGIVSL